MITDHDTFCFEVSRDLMFALVDAWEGGDPIDSHAEFFRGQIDMFARAFFAILPKSGRGDGLSGVGIGDLMAAVDPYARRAIDEVLDRRSVEAAGSDAHEDLMMDLRARRWVR